MSLSKNNEYSKLINTIGSIFHKAQKNVVSAINTEMLTTYWKIGKYIVEFEQKGKLKAEYGKQLLLLISKDLTLLYGKGFSRSNLTYMRLLYKKYPICEMLSHKLSWSHYFELLKVDDDLARGFYEKQAELENWTVKELKRQKKSGLFHRIALSKNKKEVLELSKQGQSVCNEKDLIKDPYVFEFLGIKESEKYTESDIEQAIIDNLQQFLLEFGKGFAFVGRQQRITLNNRHFYVDLVFYHIKLKCYVLVDLKLGEISYEHIGQMKLYLGYYAKEVSEGTDNEPIGIILSEEKDDVMIEYAMLNDSSKLVVSKYKLLLPDINQLKEKVREIIDRQ